MIRGTDYTISTPTGMRVLHHLGGSYAVIRPPFAPSERGECSTRLQVRNWHIPVQVAADGTWLNVPTLYSAMVSLCPKGKETPVQDLFEWLFWDANRPSSGGYFKKVMQQMGNDDAFWRGMHLKTRAAYNPMNRTLVWHG